MSLFKCSAYKPFQYPWAHEAWLKQHQMHWLPEEVPMADDVRDFNTKLTKSEQTLLTNIFRFFTQADIDVNSCYMNQYSKVFKPTEVVMMLTAFADMETMHIHAYSYLIETLNLPDHMYQEFLDYKEMREKHEYSASFNCDNDYNTALTLAAFGAFTEGLQLFGTFAVLMNFPRFNKMKGMGQIVEWSIRDETLHVESIIKLYHTFVEEAGLDVSQLTSDIIAICKKTLKLEFAFLDLVFRDGAVEGMTIDEVKNYLYFVAQHRLTQLGIRSYTPATDRGITKNPLEFMDWMLTAQHANFFESRSTEYSKATIQGDEW